MSEPIVLTPNEFQVIELLRELKANRGHGQMLLEVRDGMELTPIKVTQYVQTVDRPGLRKT